MIAPCSVKASGAYLMFVPRFKITDCDLERRVAAASSRLSRKTKSGGKRLALRLTAWWEWKVAWPPPYATAHTSDSTSACSSTVCVAFSCLSGG